MLHLAAFCILFFIGPYVILALLHFVLDLIGLAVDGSNKVCGVISKVPSIVQLEKDKHD